MIKHGGDAKETNATGENILSMDYPAPGIVILRMRRVHTNHSGSDGNQCLVSQYVVGPSVK